jgi:hypothetical protein
MSHAETEWALQKRLTRSWLRDSVAILAGEELFLAAWELMSDFRINDSRRYWNVPSIDFVLLDRAGCMVLVELKRTVTTPRESWSAICQVTHRAHQVAAGFSQPRLAAAYQDCHSGADGRVAGSVVPTELLEAHAEAFDQAALKRLPGLPVRRVIMATKFGPAFAPVLSFANAKTREDVVAALGRYKPRGEIKRYLDLPLDTSFVAAEPIRAVEVDGSSLRTTAHAR